MNVGLVSSLASSEHVCTCDVCCEYGLRDTIRTIEAVRRAAICVNQDGHIVHVAACLLPCCSVVRPAQCVQFFSTSYQLCHQQLLAGNNVGSFNE